MATVFAYKGAWVQTNAYNAADVVEHESVNYVANKSVPASTEISNTEYWFKWVPSSDTSGLMSEVKQAKSTAEAAQSAASTASSTATEAKSTAEAAQSAEQHRHRSQEHRRSRSERHYAGD